MSPRWAGWTVHDMLLVDVLPKAQTFITKPLNAALEPVAESHEEADGDISPGASDELARLPVHVTLPAVVEAESELQI
jgi:hypothetical protein